MAASTKTNTRTNPPSSDRPLRVLWAVDPFIEDKVLFRKTVDALKGWIGGRPATVEPVYVLSSGSSSFPEELFTLTAPDLSAKAQKALQTLLRAVKVPGLATPTQLGTEDFSVRRGVQRLVNHAHDTGADVIVTSSRSRKGPDRWLFGSFAETLVLHSPVPVLVVGRKHRIGKKVRSVLFPTDLSASSRAAFDRVIEAASAARWKVTLLHHTNLESTAIRQAFPRSSPLWREVEALRSRQREAVDAFVDRAEAAGVPVTVVFDGRPGRVADAIARQARRGKHDAIAMTTVTGALAAAILGSTARQVLHVAPCPVWIVRPASGEKAGRAKPASTETPRGGTVLL
jgi:nucleotide-binding universal stress UspA family protein